MASLVFGQTLFKDPVLNQASNRIKSDIKNADMVFVGSVISVGEPPKLRSGRFMATQTVEFKIEEVLKGTLPAETRELKIEFAVVAGSRTADSSKENRLSPALFSPGNRLIVVAKKQASTWLGLDENYGVIIGSDSNITAVKELVKQLSTTH